MTLSGKAFVDTNILLRAMMPAMAQHAACEALIRRMWMDETELWISRQIIREYLVQATHPMSFTPPMTVEQVFRQLDTIQTLFRIADDTGAVTSQLRLLMGAYPTRAKQVHDANIVATMLVYGIDTLLTLNVADLKRFEPIIRLASPGETK